MLGVKTYSSHGTLTGTLGARQNFQRCPNSGWRKFAAPEIREGLGFRVGFLTGARFTPSSSQVVPCFLA